MISSFTYTRPGVGGVSLEAGHCYMSRPLSQLKIWRNRVPEHNWMLWVDDVHGDPKWGVPDLEKRLGRYGLSPTGIHSERAFIAPARLLVSALPAFMPVFWAGSKLTHKQSSLVLARKEGASIVPTCPVIAAAWTAARLGFIPVPPGATFSGRPLYAVGQTTTLLTSGDVGAEEDMGQVLSALFPSVKISRGQFS